MAVRNFWFGCLCLSALFFGCSSDPNPNNFSYLRSPAYFKADTAVTDHDFCTSSPGVFASEADCRKVKKYRLTWIRPEDTTDFQGYRIYVDTIPPNTPPNRRNWQYVQGRAELASVIVTSMAPSDSIVFVFGKKDTVAAQNTFIPDTLKQDTRKIFVIDTTLRQENEEGRLVFALVPVYGGKQPPGQPQLSWFIINDKFPPDVFSPAIKPFAKKVTINWERPTDPTSFFDASLDTGVIRNYELQVTLEGPTTPDRKRAFKPKITFLRGGQDLGASVRDSLVFDRDTIPFGHVYYLPDTNRARKVTHTLQDSLSVVIDSLTPEDELKFLLWAVDSAGNRNLNAMQSVVVHLTDTTQPSQPHLIKDSSLVTGNAFVVQWQASRDTIRDPNTGILREADSANFFIDEYHLRRTLLRGPKEKTSLLDQMDTVIHIGLDNRNTAVFLDTMRFLPPGRAFLLRLIAVDGSGFESRADTLTIATDSVNFVGVDSALQCPTGFIPIPRGHFILGEAVGGFPDDEKPARDKKMDPYCIEPYEHHDSLGRFASNLSWQQADSVCRGLDTAYNTQLCSEAEWERACEGPGTGPDSTLVHGIQSEAKNPSILQSSCNQGTNDSLMAKSFDLRNSNCLTREGVYDMAGNYSEWIRDPYDSTAYNSPQYSDSLSHAFSFADSTGPHAFRGGNYLKPSSLPISAIQSLARCSNRDFAEQVRPIFRTDCIDSTQRKIAVIYGSGLAGHFCMDIPDNLRDAKITDLIPSPTDSTKILAFISGSPQPQTIDIKPMIAKDSTFKGKKAQAVRLTTRSLAVVVFEKPGTDKTIVDTLDATEMKDTSQATLAKIFAREAGNPGWVPRMNGGNFAIQYLFAYTFMGTKPAKDYYSSRAIAFRCCSLARAPTSPPVSPVAKTSAGSSARSPARTLANTH